MASNDDPRGKLGDALPAPVGELLAREGKRLAGAQGVVDRRRVEALEALYGNRGEIEAQLGRLGHDVAWSELTEDTSEIATDIAATRGSSRQGHKGVELRGLKIDATSQWKYDFSQQGATNVRVTLSPRYLKVVPDVVGRTYAEATACLQELEIVWRYDGPHEPAADARIQQQTPTAGTILKSDGAVLLKLARLG